jgi:hypothetical protein
MPRAIASIVAVALLASAGAAIAARPSSTAVLEQGLQAVVQATVAKTGDHDQGDDHASDVAILTVCSHTNPSAERSAICTQPNSPP